MSKIVYSNAACTLSQDELHRFALQRSWRRYVDSVDNERIAAGSCEHCPPGYFGVLHHVACKRKRVITQHYDPLSAYRVLIYIMLNPSKADGVKDDPTVKSCVRIANYNGYGHALIGNLWSYRSTDWKVLRDWKRHEEHGGDDRVDYVGNVKESDSYLAQIFATPGEFLRANYVRADVVFAWGSHTQDILGASRRIGQVLRIYRASPLGKRQPLCLGTTLSGNPNHPLFMAEATPLTPWTREGEAIRNAA